MVEDNRGGIGRFIVVEAIEAPVLGGIGMQSPPDFLFFARYPGVSTKGSLGRFLPIPR